MSSLPDPRRARIHAAVDALLDALQPEPVPPPSPMVSTSAQMVDKRELARALSVSVATVDRLDKEGQPHVRIGDAKRYDVAAVLAWHRERSAQQPASPSTAPASSPPETSSGVRRVSRGSRGAR